VDAAAQARLGVLQDLQCASNIGRQFSEVVGAAVPKSILEVVPDPLVRIEF